MKVCIIAKEQRNEYEQAPNKIIYNGVRIEVEVSQILLHSVGLLFQS